LRLGELVLLASIIVAVTAFCVTTYAQSGGFELSGQLQACESRETAPCWTIDGRVYLNMHPDLRSMAGILSGLEGRQVVITVHPK
jgi:hypothetical protein